MKRAVTSKATQRVIVAMATDALQPTDQEIAKALKVSVRTVLRVRTAAGIPKRRGRLASASPIFEEQVLAIGHLLSRGKVYEEAEVAAVQRLQFRAIRTGQRLQPLPRGQFRLARQQRHLPSGKALGIRVTREIWERAWGVRGRVFGGNALDSDPFAAALFWRIAGESWAWRGGREWPAAWPTVARLMLLAEAPTRQWLTAEQGAAVEARLTQRARQAAQKRWREGVERRLRVLSRKGDPALATAALQVAEWLRRTP
jgi:hypothetical protein